MRLSRNSSIFWKDDISSYSFLHHSPLTYAFEQKNDKASPRQLRHLQYISQFTTVNVIADHLSRIEAMSVIDYDKVAQLQESDNQLKSLQADPQSLVFKQYQLSSGRTLWCDVSTPNIKPYIPQSLRMSFFKQIHGLAHPGVKSTIKQK